MPSKQQPAQFIQHHKLLGYVPKQHDPEKYKNDILTEFYNSGIMKDKISGMMFRNNIKQTTELLDDFFQETFYWLCRKSPEELIELYEDNPKRLIALSVTIAKFKCFGKSSRVAEYPKHSLMMNVLHGSNLRKLDSLSDSWECVEHGIILNMPDESFNEIWDIVINGLSLDELDFLDILFAKKNSQLSKVNVAKRQSLLNSIKNILLSNEIINKNDLNENMKLSQEQIDDKVKQVIPAIELYNKTKNTNHYTNEDIDTCIEIWEQGLVFTNVVRGCNGCLVHVSDIIFSYAERNGLTTPKVDIEQISVDELLATIKPVKKRATKKK